MRRRKKPYTYAPVCVQFSFIFMNDTSVNASRCNNTRTRTHAHTEIRTKDKRLTNRARVYAHVYVCACNVMSVLITHTRAYIWLIEYPVFQSSLAPPQSTLRSRLSLRGSRRGDVQFRACVRARASLDVIRIASAIIVDAFMCRAY